MNIRLTAREREVAELVAEGLTNREIAERLVISERTAEGHVEQIRNKLGFRSRSQIAAWAAGGADAQAVHATLSDAAAARTDHGTRTFLFADLRGYTEFVERHGDAAAAALIGDYRRLVRGQVVGASGAEIKTEGDSFYVVFPSARQALDCAMGIAREAEARGADLPERPIRVGIGIHAGEPIAQEGQFVGSAVNVAARLAQNAGPGEILISEVVQGLLRTSGLPPTDERVIRMKGLPGPIRVFAVRSAAQPAAGAGEMRTGRRIRLPVTRWGRGGTAARMAAAVAAVVALAVAAVIAARPTPAASTLVAVAGLGTGGFSGDGGPAMSAQLSEPTSMAFDRVGTLIVADSFPGLSSGGIFDFRTRVRRIDVDRTATIRTVAGDGMLGFASSDSGAALGLSSEVRIALGPSDEMYIAQGLQNPGAAALQGLAGGHWVGRVDPDGRFRLVAGTGFPGYSGDGGPALRAQLFRPRGIAVGSGGVIFVADSSNNVIRAIGADGIITTVAGTGERGGSGDAGPATAATFFAPLAVAVSPDGSLYIADTNNHRIRRIDHGGNLVNVAGDGAEGSTGDGGPATRARLSLPGELAFGRDGVLYVADTGNARVRAIRLDGTITTVAGPEGLIRPTALAVHPDGTLFIADAGAHRIYKLVTR